MKVIGSSNGSANGSADSKYLILFTGWQIFYYNNSFGQWVMFHWALDLRPQEDGPSGMSVNDSISLTDPYHECFLSLLSHALWTCNLTIDKKSWKIRKLVSDNYLFPLCSYFWPSSFVNVQCNVEIFHNPSRQRLNQIFYFLVYFSKVYLSTGKC